MSDIFQPDELLIADAQIANERINEGEARDALLPPHFITGTGESMLRDEITIEEVHSGDNN